MKGLPYDADKTGQCYSCLREECANPKFLTNHPNWGCKEWTTPEARKFRESLLYWSDVTSRQLSLF